MPLQKADVAIFKLNVLHVCITANRLFFTFMATVEENRL